MNNSEFKEGQEVWAKFKIKNPEIDKAGEVHLRNADGWECWAKAEEIVVETPKKPVIPKFVAEWVEKEKITYSLYWAMVQIRGNFAPHKVIEWFYTNTSFNGDILARAWLDGYEIEQEKLYTVEIPNNGSFIVLAYINHAIKLVDGNKHLPGKFTKESIEYAGFGWVFDCSGVKVVEVE